MKIRMCAFYMWALVAFGCGSSSGDNATEGTTFLEKPGRMVSGESVPQQASQQPGTGNDTGSGENTGQTQGEMVGQPSAPTASDGSADGDGFDSVAPDMSGTPVELIETAYAWLTGTFDSSEQAARDPNFFAIQLTVCEVDAPELGDHVLYVEQATMTRLDAPYRQRLYVVEGVNENTVVSKVFSLNNEGAATGLCGQNERASFSAAAVSERIGCDVILTWNGTFFEGGTEGKSCSSTLQGAQYATSVVSMYDDRLLSWDQGFDGNDVQVWGAVSGPYEFKRQLTAGSDSAIGEMNPQVNDTLAETNDDALDMPNEEPVDMNDGDVPVFAGGESCNDAVPLADLGMPLGEDQLPYTRRMVGAFGQTDDYNPYQASGLAPACSAVYDAHGNDVVFAVTLQPGQTFNARLQMEVGDAGGLYFLDGCDNPGWPDVDESGACGRGEYRSHGNCDFNDCEPLEWTFTWPMFMAGQPNQAKELYLVVDQVIGNEAELFQLDWVITDQ